jgi:hypothetical protein
MGLCSGFDEWASDAARRRLGEPAGLIVNPKDFAPIADLARSIAGCAAACIRLRDPATGETALHFCPEVPLVKDLPAAFLPQPRHAQPYASDETCRLLDEVKATGLPGLTFWAGFALKDAQRRVIGVLGVMDVVARDLPEVRVGQLRQLAQLISGQIALAQTAAARQARQTFSILETMALLHPGIGPAALTGLLRWSLGDAPTAVEAADLRHAGLAMEEAGGLRLTPMALAILSGVQGGGVPDLRKPRLRAVGSTD